MNAKPSAFLRDSHETESFARALGHLCKGGERIALSGDLGAGKTTFVRGMSTGLGVTEEEISSPTFTLMHVHDPADERFGKCLVHVDAYRLEDPSELLELGWDEILRDSRNVIVVEWPDRLRETLGDDVVELELHHASSPIDGAPGREIVIESSLPRELMNQLFTNCRGCGKSIHAGVGSFPFCGNKCRMADLGNWFDGNYSVSREIEEDDLFDPDLA